MDTCWDWSDCKEHPAERADELMATTHLSTAGRVDLPEQVYRDLEALEA